MSKKQFLKFPDSYLDKKTENKGLMKVMQISKEANFDNRMRSEIVSENSKISSKKNGDQSQKSFRCTNKRLLGSAKYSVQDLQFMYLRKPTNHYPLVTEPDVHKMNINKMKKLF